MDCSLCEGECVEHGKWGVACEEGLAAARREGFEEAVARERERITELVEIKRAKFNIGTRASLALSDVLDQIRARSGAKGE